MISDLVHIAAAGGTVLTANKRLARQLNARFDEDRMASGQTVWPAPAILSLDAWLMRQLTRLHRGAELLTEMQSRRLWEEIIAADAMACGRDLLHVPQAARRAGEAHRLLADHLAEIAPADCDEDHLAFLRWRTAWQSRLRERRWLDRADLPAVVTAAFAAGELETPGTLLLAGFDDLTPAVRRLCDTLAGRGCRVEQWTAPRLADVAVVRHDAVDMAAEVRCCARWARAQLERAPHRRIGVVMPQQSDYQPLVERIFRAEFAPDSWLAPGDAPETFTLSLGTPLAAEGVVRAALRLLAAGEPLSIDDLGWLLRSPYLGGARGEGSARACADRSLRRRGRREWRLGALARALSAVPRMAAIIESVAVSRRDRQRRSPGEWGELFARLLQDCGWPGERGLGSREFQALEHFRGVLGQLATLDRVAGPMPRGDALALLGRLSAEAVFQPEGGEGQIQILGMLEAAGFTFDALWVLGLHDAAFPPPPRPHPFLPLPVQSRLRMPHADALREREFAATLAGRLFAAAPEVVVSWPGQLDGAPLRPSPLIRDIARDSLPLAPSCDPFLAVRTAACVFEEFVDERAVPINAASPFAGGTSILTDQALCPFRAFAHHRLHAERLDVPDLGLDGLARGSLVHGVLERFWQTVRSRDALLALPRTARLELLTAAAEETLQHHERRNRYDLPPRLRGLELRRLVAMADGWLELERERPPFRVVDIEQRHDFVAGNLRLRTRIDRIDELANGTLAVIDYKTGRPDPQQWLDARVTEPQLPLYCLDLPEDRVGAVLFAVVRRRQGECTFRGLANDPDSWPGMSAKSQAKLLDESGLGGLGEALAHWRRVLPALGDAFAAGWAAVDPVDPQQACTYCDLMPLCRIGESEGGTDGDEREGDGDG